MIMTPTTREQAHDHENGARSEFRHQVSPSFGASEISPFSMFATLGTIAELDPAAPSSDSTAHAE
jgi:hypothetical protein